jgi:hypothetical protein
MTVRSSPAATSRSAAQAGGLDYPGTGTHASGQLGTVG